MKAGREKTVKNEKNPGRKNQETPGIFQLLKENRFFIPQRFLPSRSQDFRSSKTKKHPAFNENRVLFFWLQKTDVLRQDGFFQILQNAELDHFLGRNIDHFAGPGIAGHTGFAIFQLEHT